MKNLRSYYNVNDGGILFAFAVAAILIYQVILGLALDATSQAYLWAYSFGAPLLFVLTVVGGSLIMRVNPLEAIPVKRMLKPWDAGRIVILAILAVFAFLPIATGVQWVFGKMGYHATPTYADYSSVWWKMLLGLVGMALLPAVGEEFLLRGAVYGSIRGKGTVYAIVLSALLFAILHGSPVQFIHQFLIGCIMAFLIYQTGSIWASVLFHFVNNALVIIYEFAYTASGATYLIPWWGFLIMFVVATPVLVFVLVKTGVRKSVGADGEVIPTVAAPSLGKGGEWWSKRGDYVPYQPNPKPISLYIAFAITMAIWLANTIAGWKS